MSVKVQDLIAGGAVLTAALAWNQFINKTIHRFMPAELAGENHELWGDIVYVAFVTIVVLLILFVIHQIWGDAETATYQVGQSGGVATGGTVITPVPVTSSGGSTALVPVK
jgi:hypothetical protein